MTDYFFTLVQREEPLRILSRYHRFISFALYVIGTNTATPTPLAGRDGAKLAVKSQNLRAFIQRKSVTSFRRSSELRLFLAQTVLRWPIMLTGEVPLPALQLESVAQSCESCRLVPNRMLRGRKHLMVLVLKVTIQVSEMQLCRYWHQLIFPHLSYVHTIK